jgi:hypothetical protein
VKIKFFAAALLGLAFATPAAAVQVLDCAIPIRGGNHGWLTDRYIFTYDDKAGTATVVDGIIQDIFGKPIEAKPKVVSANQTAFSWTVMDKNSRNNAVKMLYRATLLKADNSMIVAGKPAGFFESFESRGSCKITVQ